MSEQREPNSIAPASTAHARQCRDGGACHHDCNGGPCWREFHCLPLSGSGLGPDWQPINQSNT